ncbi:MAG: sulfite exporter TauE/SafE family protein [Planctomycetota bacterium]|nr:sulfite exporter TauE/SafE family protein [Planctomycetota bacterium]
MSSASQPDVGQSPSSVILVGLGLMVASVCSMCGVGGGVFAVPILHYLYGMPLKRAVATVLCLVWCVALSSTASEALHQENALNLKVVAALVGGVLVGTRLGFELAKRLPVLRLKFIFCILFAAIGLSFAVGGAPSPELSVTGDFELALSQVWMVVVIGVGAGVLVPILGIGGGLVMVPALDMALPGLGFLGARSASLATAIVGSSRSLLLYRKGGLVDWRVGGWFGLGAALGSVLGVQAVHLEGATELGRTGLGIILLCASLRFGFDCWRARNAQA